MSATGKPPSKEELNLSGMAGDEQIWDRCYAGRLSLMGLPEMGLVQPRKEDRHHAEVNTALA